MCGMSQTSQSNRFPSFWAAWSVTMLLIVGFEAVRWANPESRADALSGWLCGRDADWLPFLPIFLLGLVIWKGGKGLGPRGRGPAGSGHQPSANSHPTENIVEQVGPSAFPAPQPSTLNPPRFTSRFVDSLLSLLLGALALGVAAWTGWEMRDLPPAYHDEYSYLFQALTFLDCRTSYPSFEAMPQLFDQMHVLNEGRFASRYFPGAGVWFAAFHAIGSICGVWIAQGIVAVGASIVAGEIAGRGARVIAGLAVACGPGLCLFSQLYLAHLPTLVGLSVFLVFMLRLYRLCKTAKLTCIEPASGYRLEAYFSSGMAGLGLSYAMLCRPMTAAGVGLPFGVWLFWRCGLGPRGQGRGLEKKAADPPTPALRPLSLSSLLLLLSMGLPILAGMAVQLAYNQSITGNALLSPYQLYTDLYTPRHGYGFHNVERGEQQLGPKVLDHYDRWAENLTLPLALNKMGIRIVASGRWTLGLVPLVFVVVWVVWNWRRWSGELQLVVASIVSLHLVHLPYWFEGIMGWHYVFESAPLWAIVLGVVTTDLARQCRETGHGGLRWWWGGVLLTSFATAWFTVPPLWPGRLPMGLAEIRYARDKYARVAVQLHQQITDRSILFIRPDPADRHIDFVDNTPRLDAAILRARAPASDAELQRAIGLFPDRTPWLFDAASGQLRRLHRP